MSLIASTVVIIITLIVQSDNRSEIYSSISNPYGDGFIKKLRVVCSYVCNSVETFGRIYSEQSGGECL